MNDKPKRFYDPHPGVGGAAVPLPLPLKKAADGLDGKEMTVSQAIEILRAVAPAAEIRDVADKGFLLLSVRFGNGGMHAWRIIRYH